MPVFEERAGAAQPAAAVASSRRERPIWRLVISLAWPVLAQQLLVLTVNLSDSFLAGHYLPLPAAQQQEALGHHLLALGSLCGPAAKSQRPLANVSRIE